MNSEEISRSLYSKSKKSGLSKPEKFRIRAVLNLIGEGKKVLDLGSYNGVITTEISERGNEVWAFDASDSFENKYRQIGIPFTRGDVEKPLPYESSFFDVVFTGEVIEHLVDTDIFLDEIKRVLKREGRAIITTPNAASFPRRLLLLLGMNSFFEASPKFGGEETAGHLRYFTYGLFKDFLYSHGFEIEKRTSDVVNFSSNVSSRILAKIFPALGRSIIVRAKIRK